MDSDSNTYEAYLDIETTGLSPGSSIITVVGLYLVRGTTEELIQIVGKDISAASIRRAILGTDTVYTYNGHRFDLPFIRSITGLDVRSICPRHRDLMFDCWRSQLRGGLKKVETQLGIKRNLEGVNGLQAVWLWKRYVSYNDTRALKTLLEYNAEDVINLRLLKDRLAVRP